MLFTVTYLCFLLLIGRAPLSIFLILSKFAIRQNTTVTNRNQIDNAGEI